MLNKFKQIESTLTLKEVKELKSFYNTIDWIDFALVVLIIFYIGSGNASPLLGLLLCIVSLFVSLAALLVSRVMQRKGEVSKVRLIVRYVVWGIWIPVDIAFIVWYLLRIIGVL